MSLIVRIAWRNLRKRPGHAVFLLLVMCLSTTAVSLGLAINETGNEPWLRLHNSINGYHVQTFAAYHTSEELNLPRLPMPDPANVSRADHQLAGLAGVPEVTATSGPWPLLFTTGRVGGLDMAINVEVRDPKPATVSHPLVVSGQWLDDSDDVVVLEDGLASLLRVAPGDEVTLAGQHLRVRGSAMTTSIPRYPMQFPATVWTNPATAAKLRAAGAIPLGATLELRLARAQDAAAFVAEHAQTYGRPHLMQTWERARNRAGALDMFAVVLTLLAILLAGLTVATAAVLVTGRLAAQGRQIGALKAVGVIGLAALNAMIAAIFAARDSARSHAILRAMGATPQQTVISFVVAQFGASLLGCAAGIPLGVLLFNTVISNNVKDMATITLPASDYVAVAIATPLLYMAIAIVPATRLARRRVAPALVYE